MFSFIERPGPGRVVGAAFTDRDGGVSDERVGPLNLGRGDIDSLENLVRNGELVREALGVRTLVALDQVHGREVQLVDEAFLTGWGGRPWDERSWIGSQADRPRLPRADAAVTALPDVALLVRVADCVPVLLADERVGVVGAAHAGRVGFDLGVLEATVAAMRELGAERLTAWIGPHVCGQCYEVPEQMAVEVDQRHPGVAATTSWGTPSLDLGAGCQRQLEELGVVVHRVDPCTLTDHNLHSHRRDGSSSGRMAGLVWRVS